MPIDNVSFKAPRFADHYLEKFPTTDGSLIGGVVKWFKTPNEANVINGASKAFSIFFTTILYLATVAIIRFVITKIIWKKPEQSGQTGQPVIPDVSSAADRQLADSSPRTEARVEEIIEIPQVAAEANLDLFTLHSLEFSEVPNETILEKQPQIVAVNPKYGIVSLSELMKSGLLPTKRITLGNVNYFCSKAFKLGSNDAIVGLVEIDNQVFPRIFYHSNSQGTWRVMPFARKVSFFVDEPKKIIHFGKGSSETDTQLPILLICALNNLCDSAQNVNYPAGNIVQTEIERRELKFFLNRIIIEEAKCLKEGAPNNFYNAGMDIPFPPNPTDIRMPDDENLHPDFSNKLELKQTIPHYGAILVRIFPSKDKRLFYLFYETDDGRAFLASIEYVQGVHINSFGVREKILNIEHMDAPLLEYHQQISPAFSPNDPFSNRYQTITYRNNWNYVRELLIIQEYYKQQGRVLPDSL